MRILYADDDASIRTTMKRVLSRPDIEVDLASDGAEAWTALRASRYDLLVTDNRMPNLTGFELVKKVREAGMTLPVIVISGSLGDLPPAIHDLGCSALLSKPVNPLALLPVLHAALDTAEPAATPA